jgi:hypothetical protein
MRSRPTVIAGLGIEWFDEGAQLPPWQDLVHLGQECGTAVSLRCYVEIDSRKRQLPQLSPFAAVVPRLVSCRSIRDRVEEDLFRRSSRSLGVFPRWSPPGPRAGAIFSLEEIPAFALVVVAAPVDRLVRLGIARDMLGAMDVCLGYGD